MTPTGPNLTTPADATSFGRYVKKWQRMLSLGDWRMVVSTKRTTSMADVKCDLAARLARLRFGASFGAEPVTPETIEATAVHELLHVLTYELKEFARANTSEEDIASAEHRLINTLEPLLMRLAALENQ